MKKIKTKNKLLIIPAVAIVIASLLSNFVLYQKLKKAEEFFIVNKVFDGDSFSLEQGMGIRLSNLYAPEFDLCGGQEAKQRLEELILNKKVRLDIISFDQYKRPIALVYVDKLLVNEVILKEGWARYDGSPSPERERLKKAYDYAFENKKGIFSSLCRSEKPDNPKCIIKGNIGRADGSKTYHFPGCSEYNATIIEKDLGEQWFCSEQEARQSGYKKAQNCYGKIFKL